MIERCFVKNRVKIIAIYSKCKDNGLENQIILENELRKATKHHEFVVYYQPKINIQNGTIAPVQALVRWLHPEKGLIFPAILSHWQKKQVLLSELVKWFCVMLEVM